MWFAEGMVIQSVRLHKADNRGDTARISIGKWPGRSFCAESVSRTRLSLVFCFFHLQVDRHLKDCPIRGINFENRISPVLSGVNPVLEDAVPLKNVGINGRAVLGLKLPDGVGVVRKLKHQISLWFALASHRRNFGE